MNSFPIKKLESDAKLPTRATSGSAGYDLYSYCSGVIEPGCRKLVSTKIAMKIPDGFCGLIWPRSGLSVKNGIETGAGVIDSDYKKEIGVILHNLSDTPFKYSKGMRVAQIIITPIITPKVCEVFDDNFDDTNRGGYGSTGTH